MKISHEWARALRRYSATCDSLLNSSNVLWRRVETLNRSDGENDMHKHPFHVVIGSLRHTIETKRHRSAEVDTVFTSARCDVDLADAPSRTTYTASKSCSSASQPSESNCVTGTPGNCVAGSSSIDISSSLLSSRSQDEKPFQAAAMTVILH